MGRTWVLLDVGLDSFFLAVVPAGGRACVRRLVCGEKEGWISEVMNELPLGTR